MHIFHLLFHTAGALLPQRVSTLSTTFSTSLNQKFLFSKSEKSVNIKQFSALFALL